MNNSQSQNSLIAQTYLNSGKHLRKEGKLDEAIEQYKKALRLDPDLVPALAHLAKIYETRRELDSAISYLQQLVKLRPNNQNFFTKLIAIYSNFLSQKDNFDEVITAHKKFTQINSEELVERSHDFFGEILLKIGTRQGQIDRAVIFLQKEIENFPNSSWLHYRLGLALTKQDRLDEAISCYRKAIQMSSCFWQAYAELGKCFRKQGNKKEAVECDKRVLELNPSLDINYKMTLDLQSPENWETHKNTFKEISETTNLFTAGQYYTFAKKLKHKGEFSKAIHYLKQALHYKIKKSKPEFFNHYWDVGQLKEPSFLIIGVAKCGTTSLYRYLCQHQEVLPAVIKEPQYLNSLVPKIKGIEKQEDWSLLDKERGFYCAHFPRRPEGSKFITGEASTTNIFPRVEKIVCHWFPKIKLIAILRNPVKRAISHYNEFLKKNKQKYSLEETISLELEELGGVQEYNQIIDRIRQKKHKEHIAQGLYVYLLERWMKLFPREQFLILTNEDLAQNPAGVMKQTFDFLGLPEYDGIDYTPRNVGSYPKDIDPDLLARLQDFYRPHNQRLEEFLGRKFNWD